MLFEICIIVRIATLIQKELQNVRVSVESFFSNVSKRIHMNICVLSTLCLVANALCLCFWVTFIKIDF